MGNVGGLGRRGREVSWGGRGGEGVGEKGRERRGGR